MILLTEINNTYFHAGKYHFLRYLSSIKIFINALIRRRCTALAMENNFRERILEVLSKHPEGLTLTQIAKELGVHRHTITKYVYQLEGAHVVVMRDLKTLKLCYLKKNLENNVENSKVAK